MIAHVCLHPPEHGRSGDTRMKVVRCVSGAINSLHACRATGELRCRTQIECRARATNIARIRSFTVGSFSPLLQWQCTKIRLDVLHSCFVFAGRRCFEERSTSSHHSTLSRSEPPPSCRTAARRLHAHKPHVTLTLPRSPRCMWVVA